MAWGSALWRRMKVFMVAFSVYMDYRATRRKANGAAKEKQNILWNKVHQKNADRIFAAITELEGLWVKFGQYLSTRADVLPEAYISSLRQLQDSLPPRPVSEVCDTVEKELGKPPRELFLEFDEKPLATASIAQVHRARMMDGQDVVVKVQHQGIKECILQDLHNARVVVEWIAWAEPDYDFGPVLDEWCREVPKELDFNLEAENTRKVAENLRSKKSEALNVDPVDVLLPDIVQSSEKVLILTYMEGIRLNDLSGLDKSGVDKLKIVETITRAYAHQIYIDGFFNADPHPGNFLVSTQAPFRPILLDFGLTKSISTTFKQALAKMLLSAAEGDYSALLSAFSEMGLVLKLDMPEEAMEITNFFFRRSLPAEESVEEMRELLKENDERINRLKSRMDSKETLRTPVAAFPTDAVFFTRVLGLLRGLSSMLNVKVDYMDVMKPYAETALWSERHHNELPIFDGPIHSQAEVRLHQLLRQMAEEQRILGIQVCAYKDGKVIVDTSAGVCGKYDPRPVRPDTLFPVFSATKGVTAALLHWLAEQGKLSLRDKVASIWPEFSENNKGSCTIAHVLNHTSGLQNAVYDILKDNPLSMCKWEEMLSRTAASVPENLPGQLQRYHALSFGWICGGIAEKSSGKSFQELLEEAFVRPLNVSGEFYIGIPPGVEERLASLTLDANVLTILSSLASTSRTDQGTPVETTIPESIIGLLKSGAPLSVTSLPSLFNMLFIRRAVIPAANGHFSARALARFYAMLANSGKVPYGTSSTKPLLGSHGQHPRVGPVNNGGKKKSKTNGNNCCKTRRSLSSDFTHSHTQGEEQTSVVFSRPDIYDAFLGRGEYKDLVLEGGRFGLGFRQLVTSEKGNVGGKDGIVGDESGIKGDVIPFGHAGIGGSFGYCDPENGFAMAVTVNKMSMGSVTGDIIRLVCDEIGVPYPVDFALRSSLDTV